jgi:Anti-sigma-K factor rskA, C-terminal
VTGPEFDDLIGADVPAGEREHLFAAHEALLTAGPPPELPPGLEHAPNPEPKVTFLPNRRRYTALAAAAAIALVALMGGFAWGQKHGGGFHTAWVAELQGPSATGSLKVGNQDSAGNWPMRLSVQGLKQLPSGGYYELLLTRKGKPVASCGTFVVNSSGTDVRLNAPYKLKTFDGWVVTRHLAGEHGEPVVLRTARI